MRTDRRQTDGRMDERVKNAGQEGKMRTDERVKCERKVDG